MNANQVLGIKVLNNRGFTMIYSGAAKKYSGITITEKFIFYTQKEINLIEIYNGDDLQRINRNSLSPDDLKKIGGGFYPRDVLPNYENPNLFYIKSPISVLTAAYFGGSGIEIIFVNKVASSFIPDSKWSVVSGSSSFFLVTPQEMAEYTILPNSQIQKLHKVDLDGKKPADPLDLKYSLNTNTVYLMTEDNTLEFIKLNSPRL